MIPPNTTLGAHIYSSPPSVEYELERKVIQIMNKDSLIFGSIL
jgi:hypothetical protein